MTPIRFKECLNQMRWTSIDLVNALHCDLAWIEALESGQIAVPKDVAGWLETLAKCHAENPPPLRVPRTKGRLSAVAFSNA